MNLQRFFSVIFSNKKGGASQAMACKTPAAPSAETAAPGSGIDGSFHGRVLLIIMGGFGVASIFRCLLLSGADWFTALRVIRRGERFFPILFSKAEVSLG